MKRHVVLEGETLCGRSSAAVLYDVEHQCALCTAKVEALVQAEAVLVSVAREARAAALEEAARVSCCDVCADEFRARAATPPPTKE